MLKAPNTLPSDPIELRSTAEGLVELAKEQALRIAKLEHQLRGHQRHRFGSKSESADQLDLELRMEEEETADARATQYDVEDASEPKQKPRRKPLPPTLPRIEDVLNPGESCTCGGGLRALGEDVTEELEYIPGRFVVNRIVRPRMACRCCDKIVQARSRRDRLNVVVQGPACLRMFWSANTQIIARCIVKARFSPVRGSIWSARP